MFVAHNHIARRQQRKLTRHFPSDEMVKVVNGASSPSEHHRVAKWFKRSFQWCFQALSLRCLRRSVYVVHESPTYNCAHVQKPTCDFVHQSSFRCAPIRDTEADDDFGMRIAKQRAAEIEWHGKEAETLGTIDAPKKSGLWSEDEHERYCQGLEKFRYGSWRLIAEYVGTRTERQVLSHAQSIRVKRKRAEEREKAMEGGASKSARASARWSRSDVGNFQLDGVEFESGCERQATAGVEQSELISTCLTNDKQADELALADVGISSDALLSPLDICSGVP